MDLNPWNISLISTDYDLSDVRNVIVQTIKNLGFKAVAFEDPDFPVEPHVHSHDACLHALNLADIVILIIDKRHGGIYVGSSNISITETEYQQATLKNKIIIPCIRRNAWDERHAKKELIKQIGKTKARKLKTSYVESWSVLDFIEKIHKSATDNYLIIFNSIDDLKDKIEGRLKGLSRYIFELILKEQVKKVLSTKTTTGMSFSLNDVFERDYFVDAPFSLKCGSNSSSLSALQIIEELQNNNIGILLSGNPGLGKSTLISKSFINHAQKCIEEKSNKIPFFIILRGLGTEYKFDFKLFIENSFKKLLNKNIYPVIDYTSIYPVFYMDGFDELSEDIANIDIAKFSQSDMTNNPFIFSCRSRFASTYITDITLGSKLSYIIELEKWNKPISLSYISRFCRDNDRLDVFDEIQRSLDENPEMVEFFNNPLFITLYLWIIKESGMKIPLRITDKITLLDNCIELWAKRDLSRLGQTIHNSDKDVPHIIKAWKVSSWIIYSNRYSNTTNNYTIDKLISDIMPYCDYKEVYNDTFIGLFDISLFSGEIHGMLHEQILEHLVATAISEGYYDESFPFPFSLGYIIRPEINRIIRSILRSYSLDKLKKVYENLWQIYLDNLNGTESINIIKRNQSTYYLGRLDIADGYKKLYEARSNEKDITVNLSIAFGLIKNGDMNIEEELMIKLESNIYWDSANRGYHLIYYKDWALKDTKPPFMDDCNLKWKNTFYALLRHLESQEFRHIALRRIELFTIKRFLEVHSGTYYLTKEIFDQIEKLVNEPINHQIFDEIDFHSKILITWSDLRETWVKLSK